MRPDIRHDERGRRFVADVQGGEAELSYRLLDGTTIEYHHTWVPPVARGRGIADQLARHALEHARTQGLKVVPSCSFVRAHLARHPEHADLMA